MERATGPSTADDLDAALKRADATVEDWDPRREEACWEATGRPSRWWRQIAAAVRQEHGSRIVWAHGVERASLTLDPFELL